MIKKTIFLGFLIFILAFIAIDNGIKKVYYKEIAVESLAQTEAMLTIVKKWQIFINRFYKNPPPKTQETQEKKKTFDI